MIPISALIPKSLKATKKLIDDVLGNLRTCESEDEKLIFEDQLRGVVNSLEHVFLGPTWATDDNDEWLLPENTLGWEIAAWCSMYLRDPNSTPEDPQPWNFTDEQLRFLLWWYAVDEYGFFVYRKGVLQRLKGWG